MLIYFTLRPEKYFRAPSLTPSRIKIHGMGAEKEFFVDQLRSVVMWLRSRPVRMRFRRPLLFRSGRFRRRRFFVHLRLASFGNLLRLFALFRRQPAQAPDERDEPPHGFRGVVPAVRRHSRKALTVRDDVENLAVGQLLRIRLGQVGDLRIKIAAVKSVAAAGRSVTDGAVLNE